MREEFSKIIPGYLTHDELLLVIDCLIYEGVDKELVKRAFSRFHRIDDVIQAKVRQSIEAYARRVERKHNDLYTKEGYLSEEHRKEQLAFLNGRSPKDNPGVLPISK